MTLHVDRTGRPGRRFVAALARMAGRSLRGPVAATAVVAAWIDLACPDDAADCSWGFEYLLVVPVWVACLLGVGPWLVGRAFRGWVDPAREGRARRAAGWSAPASILLLYWAASGGGGGG